MYNVHTYIRDFQRDILIVPGPVYSITWSPVGTIKLAMTNAL